MENYLEDYKNYLNEHIRYVKKAYSLLLPSLLKIGLTQKELINLELNIDQHDNSKWESDEFIPYAKYFFSERNEKVKDDFLKAELLHKNRNPHHHDHWSEGAAIPRIYVVEMVCGWWSFSLKKDCPKEIFEWYNKKKENMKFSENTKELVDLLLNEISFICKAGTELEDTI